MTVHDMRMRAHTDMSHVHVHVHAHVHVHVHVHVRMQRKEEKVIRCKVMLAATAVYTMSHTELSQINSARARARGGPGGDQPGTLHMHMSHTNLEMPPVPGGETTVARAKGGECSVISLSSPSRALPFAEIGCSL